MFKYMDKCLDKFKKNIKKINLQKNIKKITLLCGCTRNLMFILISKFIFL